MIHFDPKHPLIVRSRIIFAFFRFSSITINQNSAIVAKSFHSVLELPRRPVEVDLVRFDLAK
jgi:hypothetical protein